MSEQRDIEERLEHYAKLAMPSYPNDLCSEAKREIARLRGEMERFGAMYDKADKEAADEIAGLRSAYEQMNNAFMQANDEIASLRARLAAVEDVARRHVAALASTEAELDKAHEALLSIRSNANCHTAELALATMPLIFDIATRASRALTDEQQTSCPHGMPNRERCSACNSY